jgi:hypothetical protein
MIEVGGRPVCSGMALVARLRDARLGVIRIVGVLEILKMAANACGIRDGVVVVDVARFATDGCVHPGQRPAFRCVTKVNVSPLGCVVTHRASGRLTALRVIWRRCRHVILLMAREAIGRRPNKLAVDVALRTRSVYVPTGQGEFRKSVVIEGCRIPGSRAVTCLASLGEACLHVRWIIRLVEVAQVAADAGSGRAGVLSA